MRNIEKVCSSCKFYEAYYTQNRTADFHRAGRGYCKDGVINGRKRTFTPKKDGEDACGHYVPADPDGCKRVSFRILSNGEGITGSGTLFIKESL